jgi:hypothetical protein
MFTAEPEAMAFARAVAFGSAVNVELKSGDCP